MESLKFIEKRGIFLETWRPLFGQCGFIKRDEEGQSEVNVKYKRCGRGTITRDSDA